MEIMASVAGFPCYAPAYGAGPSADGYPQHGVWAGGDISYTQPVAKRPISQCDDTQDDSEIGGLEKQTVTQQDDFSEPRRDGHATPL